MAKVSSNPVNNSIQCSNFMCDESSATGTDQSTSTTSGKFRSIQIVQLSDPRVLYTY